ncbi:hypothetical protein, partial [Nannocystis sp. SCPEA4]|uniref:hypothetical protein n=1 Tax=Nannocystis sp. SCPEA4 TaxID=2996787 RepID=UPI00226E7F58
MNHRSGNLRALRALACALTVTAAACGDFEDDELEARVLELEHAHELTGFTTTGPWTSTGSTSTGSTGTGSTSTSSSTGGTWSSTTDWDDTGSDDTGSSS